MSQLSTIVDTKGSLYNFLKVYAREHFGITELNGRATVDKAYVTAIQSAQENLAAIVGLSDTEKEARTEAYNKSIQEMDEEKDSKGDDVDPDVRRAGIDRLYGLLKDWVPMNYELGELKRWSRDKLDNLELPRESDTLMQKSIDDWHAEQLEIANRFLQGQISIYENQIRDIAAVNKAMTELDKSFKQPA